MEEKSNRNKDLRNALKEIRNQKKRHLKELEDGEVKGIIKEAYDYMENTMKNYLIRRLLYEDSLSMAGQLEKDEKGQLTSKELYNLVCEKYKL